MDNDYLLRTLYGMPPKPIGPSQRKVFVSYSHLNQVEAERFVGQFSGPNGVFIAKALGVSDRDDFIRSDNPAYVMQQIRGRLIQDATVTIVLVGSCTHSRRYVDWEIKASLQQGEDALPNGLIAIQLPSSPNGADLPPRLEGNWNQGHTNCYARYWKYPQNPENLRQWIEDAFLARTERARFIANPQDMMKYNAACRVCGLTH